MAGQVVTLERWQEGEGEGHNTAHAFVSYESLALRWSSQGAFTSLERMPPNPWGR
jgi:hypothetical protein